MFKGVISILVIVGVVVGAWYGYKQGAGSYLTTDLASTTSAASDKTSHWQLYRDEEVGFIVKYPTIAYVSSEDENSLVVGGETARINVVDEALSGIEAYLAIAVNGDEDSIGNCNTALPGEVSVGTQELSVAPFAIYDSRKIVGEDTYDSRSWRTIYNDACIEMRAVINSRLTDQARIRDLLESIAQTFTVL